MSKRVIFVLSILLVGIFSGVIITANFNISPLSQAKERETAQEVLPLTTEEGKSPFVKVAKEIMPAVVNIGTERTVKTEFEPFEFKGPFEEFFKKFFQRPFTPPEEKIRGLGSGFIFKKEGDSYFILTNNHVIKDADRIVVRLSDKSEYKGKDVEVIGKDPRTDIAVLKIKTDHKLPVARLGNSDSVEVGDWAIAIGNPFGLERTVTVGVVSAIGRSGLILPEGPDYQDYIQTDAAINRGNSGGPLVNIKGEVIGINSAITSPSGGFVGIGFAIPINIVQYVAAQLISKGKVTRGYIGVQISEVTPELAEAYGLERPYGAIITSVVEGTPAEKAGLKVGDIIVGVNDKEIEGVNELRIVIASYNPGTVVKLRVVHENGKEDEIEIKLTEFPEEEFAKGIEEPSEPESRKTEGVSWLGMELTETDKGVEVVKIEEGSPAEDVGIKKGDVITKIGTFEISNIEELKKAKKKYENSTKPIVFFIKSTFRGRETTKIVAIRPRE